jgi:hypothetical protein
MAVARAHPTAEHYHAWRRRVKDHWFQVRLLEGRCGDRLLGDERRLETLDGHLGEYHDCALLETVLVAGTALPPDDASHMLRLLKRYQLGLRQKAQSQGAQIYSETPRQFVKHVERAWRLANDRQRSHGRGRRTAHPDANGYVQIAKRAAEGRTSWAHAA